MTEMELQYTPLWCRHASQGLSEPGVSRRYSSSLESVVERNMASISCVIPLNPKRAEMNKYLLQTKITPQKLRERNKGNRIMAATTHEEGYNTARSPRGKGIAYI